MEGKKRDLPLGGTRAYADRVQSQRKAHWGWNDPHDSGVWRYVLGDLRQMRSPQTASAVAKRIRRPLSFVERVLESMRLKRHVIRAANEDKEIVWSLPKKRQKAQDDRMEKSAKALARFFNTEWVPSSLINRMNQGISIRALGWPCGAASMTSETTQSTSSESSSTRPPLGTTAEQDSGVAR